MEGLAAAYYRGRGLQRYAHQIIFRLLGGERRAGGLRVEAQHQGAGIAGAEAFAQGAGPEAAGGAEFRDLHKQLVVGIEEEGELRREFVHGEAGGDGSFDVGDAIRETEGDFLHVCGTVFADVIAGDGDCVPVGEFVAAAGENIGDDAHGGAQRIDVSAAGDIFLEDVILHSAGEALQIRALLFGDGDVEREENRGGGIDGHRGGNSFQRNAVEERLHVFKRIDGDA